MEKIKSWLKANKKEVLILGLILLIGAFFRLYRIADYMTFLGDEGRDVIVVRKIFTELHPPLIGPGTSIGSMYLGPLYYYMMAPALLIAGFSPVGPAVQIAILGIVTIGLVWWVGRDWFGKIAGLIAAGLYAISPTVIVFSRSSWNPNIMPFFALLSIYSIWRVWKEKEYKWMIVLGISFAFVLQSHYLGLLLLPTILIFWYLSKVPLRYTLYAIAIFAILMSPLVFFDLRHNFVNSKALYKKLPEIFNEITLSLVGAKVAIAGAVASWGIFGFIILKLIHVVRKREDLKKYAPYLLLVSWMGFALIGFGVYKQHIYDHYFGFVFAVPFLIIGALSSYLLSKNYLMKILAVCGLIFLVIVNLRQNPLKFQPNRQLQRARLVAQKIIEEDGGNPFNLAVIAQQNYEDGYLYFLQLNHAQVGSGNQLFVICEMEEKKCDPTHSPKAEVANFGISKIDTQWEVDGVIIYKLVHAK